MSKFIGDRLNTHINKRHLKIFIATVIAPVTSILVVSVLKFEPHQPSLEQQIQPIPEFAETDRIVLPIDLFQFNYHADQIVSAITHAGATVEIAGQKNGDNDGSVSPTFESSHTNIWLRDFSPLPARTVDKVTYQGFTYGSPDTANNLFQENLTAALRLSFRNNNLALEGGNFLTDGSKCYMAGPLNERDESESKTPSIAEIKAAIGCKDLIVITNPPHVHIDMFAKILTPDTVAVNELDQATLELAYDQDGDLPDTIADLQRSLDKAASQFANHLNVVRVPMPLPYKNTFRTFTNSILVNGTAVIPDYRTYGWNYGSYPDEKLLPALKEKVARVYSQSGFKPVFVNADGLIYNGGAFHCVSAHLPKTSLTISYKGKK